MNPLYGYSPLFSPYGLYAVLGTTTANNNLTQAATAGGGGVSDGYQADISSYGQLLSALSNFEYALAQLAPPYYSGAIGATSSNSSVASASATSGAQSATYALNVSQLAQAQTVESSTFADANSTVVGSGTLTIQTGAYNSASNTFNSDGSAPVSINISNGTLSSIADAINASGAGVLATVQQVSGGYALAITSQATGAASNYKITVSNDSDGNNTDTSGLSQLAYDPTAASGAGKNMTLEQSGTNANYSVNGVSATSSSNNGIQLATAVSANLLQTGTASITVGVDYTQLSSAAQNLVSAFNTLENSINTLTNNGAALQDDAVTAQLSSSLNQQILTSYDNGSSTLTTLSQIGLQFQLPQNPSQVGSLLLNSNNLQYAYNLDQTGAASLLSLSAQGLLNLSNAYSSAGYGVYPASISQLQQLLSSAATQVPYQNPNPFNLGTLLAMENQGTSNQSTLLTGPQISALSQYATIMALGQPYAEQAMLVGNLGSMPLPAISTTA
jgi:flagellar hook-associated protein 2